MLTFKKVCKLYMFACFALSASAGPILSSSRFEQNYQVPSISSNVPGVTTTFRDQNGNLVTQVKKESFNNANGQNSHLVEFEENKQLPNGYAKSFKKEYSSSSVSGSQPVFGQNQIDIGNSFNSEKLAFGSGSAYSGFEKNQHESLLTGSLGYTGINSGLKSVATKDLNNLPGVTTTFRDQNGNLVTQIKKESFNNDNRQNSHVLEFEESKQLPNGYAKSFKKEYSSSSVSGSQPVFGQNPIGFDSSFKPEKLNCGSLCSEFEHSHHEKSISGNSGYTGIHSNFKSMVDQNVKNLPGVTTTFRDQNGNLVTQVKKELFNNENGQNSHVVEFEENKQLPNGYSKSFKKEYSSSSVIGSQPSILKPTIIENSSLNKQMSGYNTFLSTKPTSSSNLGIDQPDCDETGQAIVDTTYSGQKQVNLVQQGSNYQTPVFVPKQQTIVSSSNTASGQKYEKLESFNTHQQHGQQTVDVTHMVEPTSFGQQSVNNDDISPNFSINQQKENFNEVYKPHAPIGQQVVEINKVSNFNQETGQQTVPVENFYKPNIHVGQQSIDVSSISHNTASQQQVDINKNSNLNQVHGQQTVSIDHFYQPHSQVSQQSIDISSINHHTAGQQVVNTNKNSNFNQEYGQQTISVDDFTKPLSQFGQQSIDLTNFGHNTAGQQIVDINQSSNINRKVMGQQAEKIESYYTKNHDSRGQKLIDTSGFDKSNANSESHFVTLNKGNQAFSGQQTQDLGGIFTSKNGGTQILDIGTLDKNTYNEKLSSPINYNGKEVIKVVEGQHVIEKNINLNVPQYQSNAEAHNQQSMHGQSLIKNEALGQQSIDFSSVLENNQPLQKLPGQNTGYQSSSSFSLFAEKSSLGNDQLPNGNYNKVFGKLNQLEHEITGAHSLSNLKKDNIQVGLTHSLKSMPIQKEEQESYFQKKVKENEQYLEPQSEYIPGKRVQSFSSSSYTEKKSEKAVDC